MKNTNACIANFVDFLGSLHNFAFIISLIDWRLAFHLCFRNIPSRRKPRHPSFLAESLKRAGLFSMEQECFQ
jgi:hypothetical protein